MTHCSSQQALCSRMHEVVSARGDHVAVLEGGRAFTYAQLDRMIGRLHRELGTIGGDGPVGLILDRSALAYASMWASIGQGRTYVPLNTSYPLSRLRTIIDRSGIDTFVCDDGNRDLARALGVNPARLIVAAPDDDAGDCTIGEQPWWQARSGHEFAYVLFTSGSTGQPKGVPISYDNLLAFVDNMDSVIEYKPDDVCSQLCELSFDFSVHEIYLALLNGCTLCPARRVDLFNPLSYIARCSITVWIAVPSLARVVLGNGVPLGESLHGVRLCIFNGEALTSGLAAMLHEVAPQAEIWNSYGPTECTVAVTALRWSDDPDLEEADVVGLGTPFPDCRAALLADSGVIPVADAVEGGIGELLLDTPQRFSGYTDPALPSPFVHDGRGTTYYRTGDRVMWKKQRLFHLGRVDHQVKIGGHRIELLEIEHRLRHCIGIESLAVIAHPPQRPTELILFVAGDSGPPTLHREALGLPAYMTPKRTVVLDALPTTSHGKLDRAALQSLADAGK